jgi:hypothetical protein
LDDIASLQRQLDEHDRVFRELEVSPGRGYVAAEAVGRPQAPAVAPRRSYDELELDEFWEAMRQQSNLNALQRRLAEMEDMVPAATFQQILARVPQDPKQASAFIGNLNAMIAATEKAIDQNRDVRFVSRIIDGLASEDLEAREAANFLMRRAAGVPTEGKGLAEVGELLERLDLNQIQRIRNNVPTTGDAALSDTDVFVAMRDIVRRTDGQGQTIMRLINAAGPNSRPGSPDPDLFRLQTILLGMGDGPHRMGRILAVIDAYNTLTAQLAALGDDFVTSIFTAMDSLVGQKLDIPVEAGIRQFRKVPHFLDEQGTLSGSKVIAEFTRPQVADHIVGTVVGAAGEISSARWKQFTDALEASDLPDGIRNNIIGEMWERVTLASRRASGNYEHVLAQTDVSINGTTTTSRADVILINSVDPSTNTVHLTIEDCKAGYPGVSDVDTLSPAQRAIHDLVKPGQPHPNLSVDLPDEVLARLPDPDNVVIIVDGYVITRPEKLLTGTQP